MATEPQTITATHATHRNEDRIAVPLTERAFVEFDYPQPTGKRRRLSLLDMSSAGLCFALPFYGLSGSICPRTSWMFWCVSVDARSRANCWYPM